METGQSAKTTLSKPTGNKQRFGLAWLTHPAENFQVKKPPIITSPDKQVRQGQRTIFLYFRQPGSIKGRGGLFSDPRRGLSAGNRAAAVSRFARKN
jgi:hypothetical protein